MSTENLLEEGWEPGTPDSIPTHRAPMEPANPRRTAEQARAYADGYKDGYTNGYSDGSLHN